MISNSGAIVERAALTNGRILIGSDSAAPSSNFFTGGTGISIGIAAGVLQVSNSGVTSVASGTGLSGGPITTTGTLSLANTAVTIGSYTRTNLTVDQQGRITSAANGSGAGTVTSIATGTGLSGGTITSTGTLVLANTAVTLGSYTRTNLTVDQQGRITAAANGSGAGTVTSIATGTGLSGGTVTSTGTLVLANTAVTLGSYTRTNLTVDQQGRITAAANGSGAGTVTSVVAGNGLSGGTITGTGTISLTAPVSISNGGTNQTSALSNNRVIASSAGSIVEIIAMANGELIIGNTGVPSAVLSITAGTGISRTLGAGSVTLANTGVTSVASGTGLTGGPITTTGTLSLANTAVTPASYTRTDLTVDQQGRITAASNGSGGGGTVTSVVAGNGLSGGTITGTGTLAISAPISIANGGTNNATAITGNNRFMISIGGLMGTRSANWSNGFVIMGTTGLYPSPVALTPGTGISVTNGAGSITVNNTGVTSVASGTGLTGGPITTTGTLSLANTAVTPASYTRTNLTVDQQGRITAASNGSGGGGTVTSVVAGSGLLGGTITGTGTLSLPSPISIAQGGTNNAAAVGGDNRFMISFAGVIVTLNASWSNGNVIIGTTNSYPSPAAFTSGTGISISNGAGSVTVNNTGVTSISSGTGLTGGPITTTGTLSLANTAVTPASYTQSNITVDQQGRLTAASNGTPVTGTVTSIATGSGLTGGPVTTTGTVALSAPISIANGGTNNTAALNNNRVIRSSAGVIGEHTSAWSNGQVLIGNGSGSASIALLSMGGGLQQGVSGGSITIANTGVTSIASGTGLTGGPITTTGTLSLANTAVTPGTYSNASITVDQQGRLTAADVTGPAVKLVFYDDFMNAPLINNSSSNLRLAGDTWWQQRNANFGYSGSPTTTTSNEMGVVYLRTNTGTGEYIQWTKPSQTFTVGKGAMSAEWRVRIDNMGTFAAFTRFGFFTDVAAFDTQTCVAIRAETSNANWRLQIYNGSTGTTTAGSIPYVVGTWTKIRLDINAAGTLASLFVNGVAGGTASVGMPSTSTPLTFGMQSRTSSSSSSMDISIDYVFLTQDFTSSR